MAVNVETLRSSGQESKLAPEKRAAFRGVVTGLAASILEAAFSGAVKFGPWAGVIVAGYTWYQARLGKRRSP